MHAVHEGNSKLADFSTRRRKTEGRISKAVQISNMERRDGLVLPRSMRLMNALSYPAFAARASWLIFCSVRRLRNNSPKTTEGSLFGLFVFDVATPHCGTASILRAAYNSCGGRSAYNVASDQPPQRQCQRTANDYGDSRLRAIILTESRSSLGSLALT